MASEASVTVALRGGAHFMATRVKDTRRDLYRQLGLPEDPSVK